MGGVKRLAALPDREHQVQKLAHTVSERYVAAFSFGSLPGVQGAQGRILEHAGSRGVPQVGDLHPQAEKHAWHMQTGPGGQCRRGLFFALGTRGRNAPLGKQGVRPSDAGKKAMPGGRKRTMAIRAE
jgi:hypothetical protein